MLTDTRPVQAPKQDLYEWHTVVIVDDEPEVLSSLRRSLEREPYDVITTDRPETVLEWLARKDVTLVIADQRMPGMTGSRFLEEVWRRSPLTAGVLLTGYPESAPATPGFRSRLQGLIAKPWNDESLKRTIRRLLYEREIEQRNRDL